VSLNRSSRKWTVLEKEFYLHKSRYPEEQIVGILWR